MPGKLPTPPDIYFSADDGLSETRHVFLKGNGLPEAWAGQQEFIVSELGFGTGLNLLALATLASQAPMLGAVPRIVYQSVEWEPRPLTDFDTLVQRWPELEKAAHALAEVYRPQAGWNRWSWPWGSVVLFVGDARCLPDLSPTFEPSDAWFLDGYAPDRNPEMWSAPLLNWVGRTTKPGGTAATYSAAGVVKRGLREAGFTVVRAPGWGNKRHMVKATR